MIEPIKLNNQVDYNAEVEFGKDERTEDDDDDEAYSTCEDLKALTIATAFLERAVTGSHASCGFLLYPCI